MGGGGKWSEQGADFGAPSGCLNQVGEALARAAEQPAGVVCRLQSQVSPWGAVGCEVGAGLLGWRQSRPNSGRKHPTAYNAKNKINSSGQVSGQTGKSEAVGGGHVGAKQCCVVRVQPSKTSVTTFKVVQLTK